MQPWTGEMGITETVDQIMAREMATPIFEGPRPTYFGPEHEVDRSRLPQNPLSPKVSQWPPAASGFDGKAAREAKGGKGGGGGPYTPQTLGLSFDGVVVGESGYLPPDSMGAVGPTQILFCENGRIKVFNKTGGLGALNTSTNTFFNSVRAGSGTSDPQVRYDRLSQRWFVLMINVSSPNRILLAVSSGPTITGTSSFTFFQFQQDLVAPIGNTNQLADYPSLGVDANALYVAANMFGGSFTGTTGWVIRKSSVLGAGPLVATAFRGMTPSGGSAGPFAPRGVDNDDPAATEGYFIGPDNAAFGRLVVRRISNPGGSPSISGNLNITVPSTYFPLSVTPLGSTRPLDGLDDRLFYAALRTNRLTGQATLWTSHNVRVSSTGVASSSGNRSASRWYQLQNLTGTPSLVQSGTLFDGAATPIHYWMPSVNMNGQGHMAIGTSMAGATNRADIAAAGRWASDALGTTQAPTQATFTTGNYNAQASGTQRWGDYSMTWVDPNDDMTMWTFQEYCNSTNSWAVRVIELRSAPPATITSLVPNTINQGQTTNIVVNGSVVNGSGFFDPGTSFPNRLAAALSGSGVTVNSVSFTSPTQFTMNVTASGAAATGGRNLTVTNPDGQTSVLNNALTVSSAGPTTVNPSSFTIFPGLHEAGTVSDLLSSDNLYVRAKRNVAADQAGFPITIYVNGTSPTANPSSFQFRAETRVNISGLRQHVQLYDYSAAQWVEMDVRLAPTFDSVVTVTGTGDLSRFVQAGTMAIRARVGIEEFAVDSRNPWSAWFDQLVWFIGQ